MSTPRDDYDIIGAVFGEEVQGEDGRRRWVQTRPAEVPIFTRLGFLCRMAEGFIPGVRERNESVLRDYAEMLKRIPPQFYQAVWNELIATWRKKHWPYAADILEVWERVRPVEPRPEHPAMTKERARAQAFKDAYAWLASEMGQVALQYRIAKQVVRLRVDEGKLDWTEPDIRRLAMRRVAIRRECWEEVQLAKTPEARAFGVKVLQMMVDGQDTAEEDLAREYLKGYVPASCGSRTKGEAVRPAAEAAAATA